MNIKFITTTIFIGLSILLCRDQNAVAQKYVLQNSLGSFSVSAPAKTIFATTTAIDFHIEEQTGQVYLQVPVNSFQFSNNFVSEAMNEEIHSRFNSYYMESDQYPTVTYTGNLLHFGKVNFNKDGNYPIIAEGKMNIHGVERDITAKGNVKVNGKTVSLESKIVIHPKQYGIRIPAYIGNMYFKEVFIELKGSLKRMH